ncbi:hypothetical protein HPP92_022711 [Vanilla planifolia]|uniref:Uncharacterized protein n=1 Tax=Vanilla planifolia TaxID=51239 RepID=A0A835PV89_VANPL|nr:hypothetical protein HPP92_022711 [Vanilla planifolia]
MMTPLPNVRQTYSLVIQEQTQRQLSSELTKNFTIATNVQSKASGIKNTKTCDHCHRSGHTIEECRTLKYYCKFCDKSGHTEDRCRRKNNKVGLPQQNRASRSKPQSAANIAENSNMNDDNSLMSFSPEYLQQLAKALSTINHNYSSDSGATDHMTSHTSFLSKSQPSFSHTNLPALHHLNRMKISKIFAAQLMTDNLQPGIKSTWFAAINHSSPCTSPRRNTRVASSPTALGDCNSSIPRTEFQPPSPCKPLTSLDLQGCFLGRAIKQRRPNPHGLQRWMSVIS